MSITYRWEALVQASGGILPTQLKPFQIDTQKLLEAGRHALVSASTGVGKTIIQLLGSSIMGGGDKTVTYNRCYKITTFYKDFDYISVLFTYKSGSR